MADDQGSARITTSVTPNDPTHLSDSLSISNDSFTIPSFNIDNIKLENAEDPRNWSPARKWSTTAIISLMGFISPLGSSVVVPGAPLMDRFFSLHSRELSLLPVSFFVLGLGVGPFLLAPASELKGRHPIFLVSCFIFVLFNIGTAFSSNYAALNFLRFLAGAAGSTGPSLGAGSIGDMFAPKERGRAQSLYGLGPLLGPVCGAIAGGWLVQSINSWRWLLWFLTILSAVIAIIVTLFLKETFAPVLLRKKIQRLAKEHLRSIENLQPTAIQHVDQLEQHRRTLLKRFIAIFLPSPELRKRTRLAMSRPFRLLFGNPICAIFSLYMGFIYGIIFLFLTQHPLLFQRHDLDEDPASRNLPSYGFSPGLASLTYLGLGLGFLVAASVNVLLQDSIYARLVLNRGRIGWVLFKDREEIVRRAQRRQMEEESNAEKNDEHSTIDVEGQRPALVEGNFTHDQSATSNQTDGRPEFRLPLCLVGMIILPLGLFVFGWTATAKTHFMLPLLGSFLVGVGSILPFQAILVYLVDAFIPFSASATACAVLVRCILAAVFPLFSEKMFVALGFGWGSTLLALVSMLAIPVPIILFWRGEQLRERFKFKG
ncbi:MFS general substrate transporter [Meira miltonrushii]|uniref:MFS general substrate transporter n=1 Tax=Meira miltonrushii TaxID=1280837 RepID=A0A316V229_9BASI|nr:MFS general substrate transporter [Meira miltonrushii]PWN31324.1 MFS general substrate transporter [Meira miltonrushii]